MVVNSARGRSRSVTAMMRSAVGQFLARRGTADVDPHGVLGCLGSRRRRRRHHAPRHGRARWRRSPPHRHGAGRRSQMNMQRGSALKSTGLPGSSLTSVWRALSSASWAFEYAPRRAVLQPARGDQQRQRRRHPGGVPRTASAATARVRAGDRRKPTRRPGASAFDSEEIWIGALGHSVDDGRRRACPSIGP